MTAENLSERQVPGNIFLVGLMGAGKTSVGRLLAQHLGKVFYDCDHEIERRTGVRIPVIFDVEGEAGFRMREAAILQELTRLDDIVLATGGGAVLNAQNRRALSAGGTVVYLRASLDDLWRRVRHDRNRPLLQTPDARRRLAQLYVERDPLYREVANVIVDSGNQSLRSLARLLEHRLVEHHSNTAPLTPPAGEIQTSEAAAAYGKENMKTVNVMLADRKYPIYIGDGLLARTHELLAPHLPQRRAALVTDTIVADLYLDAVASSLSSAGVDVVRIVLPTGEEHKAWQTLNTLFDALVAARCERKTSLIALGGGVIGDITGFAAASYMRGVPFIQIPTTLLAQVDSSVGGKTAINHPRGKNIIGAFYQPRAVLTDTATLRTLPRREVAAGLAEVIKYGLIRDQEFFAWLEANIERLLAGDGAALAHAIQRSCEIKAAIAAADEREETGERALLNLGHTFGHAIETGTGYGTWLHGEAVAAGTVLASRLSQHMGLLNESEVARTISLFARARLPVDPPALGYERYLQLMGLDKKVEGGKMRFVLLRGIGNAFLSADVPAAGLAAVLGAAQGNA